MPAAAHSGQAGNRTPSPESTRRSEPRGGDDAAPAGGKQADTSFDALLAASSAGEQPIAHPTVAPIAELEVQLAGAVGARSDDIGEWLADGASGTAQFLTMPVLRAELASMRTAHPGGAAPIAASAVVESSPAALATIAISEGEWIDDIGILTSDATPERNDARALDSAGDRAAVTRSTPDTTAPEPAREPTPTSRAHDPDRAAEILKQIRLRLSPELRQATIHLAPPELGRLSIHLTLDDRRLTAAVRTERQETLEVLGRHLPELRAALALHGIEAEQFELTLGFQREPHAQSNGRDGERTAPGAHSIAPPDSGSVRDEPLMRALASASGVDLYA